MSKTIKGISLIIASSFLAIGSTAFAADGAATFTAKGCNACHGADAKTPVAPTYPKLAGQGKEYLMQQLKDIKSGARNNGQTAVMKGIMAGVSEDEIKVLAEYISGLK